MDGEIERVYIGRMDGEREVCILDGWREIERCVY